MSPIVAVENLSVAFASPHGDRQVLTDVSLELLPGEVLGVVGEAGAGKSVLVRSVLGLLPEDGRVVDGRVLFRGRDLLAMSERQIRALRSTEISQVLPDAKAQLNPLVRVGDFLTAVLRAHRKVSGTEAEEAVLAALVSVGITDPERRLQAYPHELSGGMAQRVCIALALLHSPPVIVADEPTQGLDVTVQRQVLDLMSALAREKNATQLIVTRDLGIVAQYCQRVAVMHRGRIVETAPTLQLFEDPGDPYTKGFLRAAKAGRWAQRGGGTGL
jgi:ABC-type dipeptide/oligopeptide/nickel transport system ATPase component